NKPPTKNTNPFGWWPLWQEVVPLEDGRPDKALVVANVGAGLMIGIRQGLSAMMTSSLIFTTADVPELNGMFAFGISMMWLSSAISAAWYGAFGRMQAGLIGINDVIGILWGTMGGQVAVALAGEPE
ncbi:YGR125W, partial [Symbiodinium microadriaticum]